MPKVRKDGEHLTVFEQKFINEYLKKLDHNHIKYGRIEAIHNDGLKVVEVVFSTHEFQREAYAQERLIIGILRPCGLTNASPGQLIREDRDIVDYTIRLNQFIDNGVYRLLPKIDCSGHVKDIAAWSNGVDAAQNQCGRNT